MGNLVALSDVKAYMQITTTNSDTLLGVYVGLVEAELDAYLDRHLAQTTYTEVSNYLQSKFDRTAQVYLDAIPAAPKLFLKNFPVTTITAVVDKGLTITNYTYDPDNGVVSPGYQLVEPTITYVAGYTTVTFPVALAGVIDMGVSQLFYNNQSSRQKVGNVKSKSIKDFSVGYGNGETGLTTTVNGQQIKSYLASNKAILDHYQAISI